MKTKIIETLKGTFAALIYLIGIVTIIMLFKEFVPIWVYYTFFFGTVLGFCIYIGMPKYTYWSYVILMKDGIHKTFFIKTKEKHFPIKFAYEELKDKTPFVILNVVQVDKDYFEYLENKNNEKTI